MPLYSAFRTDATDYDEHDEAILRAPSLAAARALVLSRVDGTEYHNDRLYGFKADGSNWDVEPVPSRGPAEFILSSFNAG